MRDGGLVGLELVEVRAEWARGWFFGDVVGEAGVAVDREGVVGAVGEFDADDEEGRLGVGELGEGWGLVAAYTLLVVASYRVST